MTILSLSEFRCKWCGRLLSRLCIEKGRIEIKCPNKTCKGNKDRGINSYTIGYEELERPEKERTAAISKGEIKL